MKCNWQPLSTGGFECSGCGSFTDVALPDRECPGRPQLVKAVRERKPCNCGHKRTVTEEQKVAWMHRLQDRKLEQLRKIKVI